MSMFKTTKANTPEEYMRMIDEPRKKDIEALDALIRKTVPNLKPFMIAGMIGYGPFHYKYASGREGDWCIVGLASQKNYISVYVCAASGGTYVAERYKEKLPKANIGKSCIRFKKLSDIDTNILQEVLREGEKTGFSL